MLLLLHVIMTLVTANCCHYDNWLQGAQLECLIIIRLKVYHNMNAGRKTEQKVLCLACLRC